MPRSADDEPGPGEAVWDISDRYTALRGNGDVALAYFGHELASDRLYRRAALEAAAADPARVLRLAAVKQGRFWSPWPPAWPGWGKAIAAAYFVPFLALAAWGGWRLWRGGGTSGSGTWAVGLTWGPVLGLAAVRVVLPGEVRYRLPGEFPLAAAAGVALPGIVRPRRRAA